MCPPFMLNSMKFKSQILVFAFISLFWELKSQKEDFIWIVGGDSNPTTIDTFFGNSSMDFNYEPVKIQHETKHIINMAGGNGSVCDKNGEVLFYSNGQVIFDKNNQYIEDTINYSYELPLNCNQWENSNRGNQQMAIPSGLLGMQRILILPVHNFYYAIYNTGNRCNGSLIYRTLFSKIEVNEDLPNGRLVTKDKIIHNYTTITSLHVVRHGNGRDWWIVSFTDGFDSLVTTLLTHKGIENVSTAKSGYTQKAEGTIGQIVFSPDGNQLAVYTGNTLFSSTGGGFALWDFDRCSGTISNMRNVVEEQEFLANGVAFSQDSRYLYLANGPKFWQYDVKSSNILQSKKLCAVIDSFYHQTNPNSLKYYVNFSHLKLGPDMRIYIFPSSATQRYISYIDLPHETADQVGVRQHAIYMPRLFTRTVPNIPEFRLGPDDGSPCDTLGLDNHPVAKFRYEPDSINYKRIRFTDLSYFRPETWSWDFGDGSPTVTDRYPFHTYDQNGTYEVCLTVSNENSSHTTCRTVTIGTSTAEDAGLKADITLFPNPVSDVLLVTLGEYIPQHGMIHIHDATGRVILSQCLYYGHNNLDMTKFPPGLYFWTAEDNGVKLKGGKVVKM